MDQIAFLFSNAFHVYVIYRFASRIFLDYPSYKKSVIAAVVYYVLNTFCALYLGIPILNLITSILGLCFLVIPCNDLWVKRVFFVILITSIGFVCDVMVYSFVNNPGYLLSIGILTNFVLFILEIILETIFDGKYKTNFEKKEWIVLCSVPIGSVVMLFILDMNKEIPQSICLICSIICFLINIIIFRLYDTLSSYYEQLILAQQNELQLHLYENKIKAVESTEKYMNSYRHDLNNHLSMLRQMAKQEDSEKILHFLDELSTDMFKENKRIFTKHQDFNLLIGYLYEKAKSLDIEPEIKMDIPSTLSCNIYDMNIIISNLFDNALEAAADTNDKKINLDIKYFKGIMQIKLVNSHNNSMHKMNDRFQSTKKDLKIHGYGIKNVEKVVEKYCGNVEFKHDDKCFVSTVIIYL